MSNETWGFDPHKMSPEEWEAFSDWKEQLPFYFAIPPRTMTRDELDALKLKAAEAGRKMDVEKVVKQMGYKIVD